MFPGLSICRKFVGCGVAAVTDRGAISLYLLVFSLGTQPVRVSTHVGSQMLRAGLAYMGYSSSGC